MVHKWRVRCPVCNWG